MITKQKENATVLLPDGTSKRVKINMNKYLEGESKQILKLLNLPTEMDLSGYDVVFNGELHTMQAAASYYSDYSEEEWPTNSEATKLARSYICGPAVIIDNT